MTEINLRIADQERIFFFLGEYILNNQTYTPVRIDDMADDTLRIIIYSIDNNELESDISDAEAITLIKTFLSSGGGGTISTPLSDYIVNNSASGNMALDFGKRYFITTIGNTTFTFGNLPPSGKTDYLEFTFSTYPNLQVWFPLVTEWTTEEPDFGTAGIYTEINIAAENDGSWTRFVGTASIVNVQIV